MRITSCPANKFFHALFLVLIFVLPIDLKFVVGAIQGHGKRVAQSLVHFHGALIGSYQLLHLKLTDIISLLMVIFLVIGFARREISLKKLKSIVYLLLFSFIVFMFFVLLFSFSFYSLSQFKVCLFYLIKFAEVSLFYLFSLLYLRTSGALKKLVLAFFLGGGLASIVGLINPTTAWFSGVFIFDRVEFYGILTLFIFVCFFLLSINSQIPLQFNWRKWAIYLMMVIASVAILECGKRTVMLGFIIGLFFLVVRLMNRRNFFEFILLLIAIFLLSWSSILFQFGRSYNPHRDVYYQTVKNGHVVTFKQVRKFLIKRHRITRTQYLGKKGAVLLSKKYHLGKIVAVRRQNGQWLRPRMSASLQKGWIKHISLQRLGPTIEDRIARWFVSIDVFKKHPVVGVGFYGIQYIYHYLPDSTYFQILVEGGILGFLFFLSIIGMGFYYAHQCIKKSVDRRAFGYTWGIVWQSMAISMLVMGLAANVFYIFNLVGLFWIFTAITEHFGCANNIRQIESIM